MGSECTHTHTHTHTHTLKANFNFHSWKLQNSTIAAQWHASCKIVYIPQLCTQHTAHKKVKFNRNQLRPLKLDCLTFHWFHFIKEVIQSGRIEHLKVGLLDHEVHCRGEIASHSHPQNTRGTNNIILTLHTYHNWQHKIHSNKIFYCSRVKH